VVGDTEKFMGNYGFSMNEIYFQLSELTVKKYMHSERIEDGTIVAQAIFNIYSSVEARNGGARPLRTHGVNIKSSSMENMFDTIFKVLKTNLIDTGMDAQDRL